ncbi:Sialic acid-specific 9-O-acetylesterase [Durusdinium trenchii]|uniref:Sialic acid-specific 9-O-acetylesterase n=1 Tax=Durusdinium trenchii TaxID=1381693 RepID=A0ABP0QD16_9DINO
MSSLRFAPKIFDDNMVLQRNGCQIYGTLAGNTDVSALQIKVFDETLQQQEVIVPTSAPGQIVDAGTVYRDGVRVWIASFSVEQNFTHNYTIQLLENDVEISSLTGVRFGDVFLAVGQSNMEATIRYDFTYAELRDRVLLGDFNASDVHAITFNSDVGSGSSSRTDETQILMDRSSASGPWNNLEDMAKNNFDGFKQLSAVATHHALHLRYIQPDIPIGVVTSARGGSPVDEFMTRSTFDYTRDVMNIPFSRIENPTSTYYGLISPLKHMRFARVLYYQGEANMGFPGEFMLQLENLIKGYREDFRDPDLPFTLIQIIQDGVEKAVNNKMPRGRLVPQIIRERLDNVQVVNTVDLFEPFQKATGCSGSPSTACCFRNGDPAILESGSTCKANRDMCDDAGEDDDSFTNLMDPFGTWCTSDLGVNIFSGHEVHPRLKQIIGRRSAAVHLGKLAPRLESCEFDWTLMALRLRFETYGAALQWTPTQDRETASKEFQLCEADDNVPGS